MRRDFTVNAMALVLAPSGFGRLVDPCGGRHDLRRRVLRPLHPAVVRGGPDAPLPRRALRRAPRRPLRTRRSGGARAGPADRRLSGAVRPAAPRGDRSPRGGVARPTGAFDRALRWQLLRLWDRRFRVGAQACGRTCRAVRRFETRARAAGAAVDGRDLDAARAARRPADPGRRRVSRSAGGHGRASARPGGGGGGRAASARGSRGRARPSDDRRACSIALATELAGPGSSAPCGDPPSDRLVPSGRARRAADPVRRRPDRRSASRAVPRSGGISAPPTPSGSTAA